MNARDAAHELIATLNLPPPKAEALLALASPPLSVDRFRVLFWRTIMVLAAGLIGFGVILWVAANWETFGRFGRFGLLMAALALTGSVAAALLLKTHTRAPMAAAFALTATLLVGALFAYFGQTYQTGADPWQLFAWWALLALPICLAVRSDIVWPLWIIVAMLAINLWLHVEELSGWGRAQSMQNLLRTALAWVLGAAFVVLVSPLLERYTGAKRWSFRTAITLFAIMVTSTGVLAILASRFDVLSVLSLVVVSAGVVWLSQRQHYDVFGLSAFVFSALTLCYALVGRGLYAMGAFHDIILASLLMAVIGAGMLAFAVQWILKRHRAFAGVPS
jgi:uncharacterized membrane protein